MALTRGAVAHVAQLVLQPRLQRNLPRIRFLPQVSLDSAGTVDNRTDYQTTFRPQARPAVLNLNTTSHAYVPILSAVQPVCLSSPPGRRPILDASAWPADCGARCADQTGRPSHSIRGLDSGLERVGGGAGLGACLAGQAAGSEEGMME